MIPPAATKIILVDSRMPEGTIALLELNGDPNGQDSNQTGGRRRQDQRAGPVDPPAGP